MTTRYSHISTVGLHRPIYVRIPTTVARYQSYWNVLTHNGIPCRWLDVSRPGFWDELKECDCFVYPWAHKSNEAQLALSLIPVVERQLGISCYPNVATCWTYDDKIRQAYLMEAAGYPMARSWVFWTRESALEWLRGAVFPLVMKLRGGAGSLNVVLLRTVAEARHAVEQMFSGQGVTSGKLLSRKARVSRGAPLLYLRKEIGRIRRRLFAKSELVWSLPHRNYVYFQQFLAGNEFDTRVTVIGNRAFAFRRFNRPGDFRASGSGRLDPDPSGIDLDMVRIAHDISRSMGFQSMAYDFIRDAEGLPQFVEISYTYMAYAVHACPGYWDAELNWHEGHFWPQYCQMADLLEMPDLKQPDMSGD